MGVWIAQGVKWPSVSGMDGASSDVPGAFLKPRRSGFERKPLLSMAGGRAKAGTGKSGLKPIFNTMVGSCLHFTDVMVPVAREQSKITSDVFELFYVVLHCCVCYLHIISNVARNAFLLGLPEGLPD